MAKAMVMILRVASAARAMVLSVGVLAASAVFDNSNTARAAMASEKSSSSIISLANPIRERTDYYVGSAISRIVMGREIKIDESETEHLDVKPGVVTKIFTPNTPEIYVVVEFVPSPFDIFRLVARFILEDLARQPNEIPFHTIRAEFKNASMGGNLVLLMKQPQGGFPVGNYRLEIHDEDLADVSLVARTRFQVVATDTTPAPSTR